MRKRPVQSQLISNYDIIGNDLDKGVQNDIIFLDFSKAFDKVPHNLLLHKLKTFGFNNKLLNWFTDYLSEKIQTVIVEDKQSENLPVTPVLEFRNLRFRNSSTGGPRPCKLSLGHGCSPINIESLRRSWEEPFCFFETLRAEPRSPTFHEPSISDFPRRQL